MAEMNDCPHNRVQGFFRPDGGVTGVRCFDCKSIMPNMKAEVHQVAPGVYAMRIIPILN